MMILESLKAVGQNIARSFYRTGNLYRVSRSDSLGGDISQSLGKALSIRVQKDSVTQNQRIAAGDKYTGHEARFLVLTVDAKGREIDPAPKRGDILVLTNSSNTEVGFRWSIMLLNLDPVESQWDIMAAPWSK